MGIYPMMLSILWYRDIPDDKDYGQDGESELDPGTPKENLLTDIEDEEYPELSPGVDSDQGT